MNDALKELEPLKQWVAYRKVWNEKRGKYSKPPINIRTGTGNDWNSPEGMGTYQEAYSYAIMHDELIASLPELSNGGISFVFTENDNYCGIDLDHVINPDGSLIPEAAEIVALMDSYTEYSLSGKGLHIIFKLSEPLASFCDTHRHNLGISSEIEIYDSGRHFTVSDRPYGELKPIAERTEQCKQVCAKYITAPAKPSIIDWKYNPDHYKSSPVVTRSEDLSDSELWQKMFLSQNGADIQALYNGDTSAYGNDHSRADLALCSYLAYWTNGDSSRIDRMFRQSGLMRDKWLRSDYRDMTISKALNDSRSYSGTSTTSNKSSDTHNESAHNTESNHRGEEEREQDFSTMADYASQSLLTDIDTFTKNGNRDFGFLNLGHELKLYNGLYVIGAVSSLGKTSFCLQIADQLAQAGEHVLYFSLEQTRLELATKSLSRLTAIEDICSLIDHKNTTAISAINIRRGTLTPAVHNAIKEYSQFAGHEVIKECGFNTTIQNITCTVQEYIRTTGNKPVVFVDYLQCVKNPDNKLTEKQILDGHVQALKDLANTANIPVILISSFNRENYLSIVDFTSFSGSSGIEYTADVVLGLQLLGMNAKIFNSRADLWLKRKFARLCMSKSPRQLELVVLKNRFGKTGLQFFFDYYAAFDCFIPNGADAEELEAQIKAEYDAFEKKYNDKKKNSGNGNYQDI